MEEEKKLEERGRPNDTHLLQVAVICLAVVSFFTTANGMKQYIFNENGVIAYTASAAIQGILLALSMNLPGYLRGIRQRVQSAIAKGLLCFFAVLLTGVVVFCSSWFSYVYIAETIHQDSWGSDSELLTQQAYRSELYAARDYAHAYRVSLEEGFGEQILLLEQQAKTLFPDVEQGTEMNWEEERAQYGSAAETAGSYMDTVINAMERAIRGNSSQEDWDQATGAVLRAKENITDRLATIQQNIDTLNSNLESYNTTVRNLTERIRTAPTGADTTGLRNALDRQMNQIDRVTQRQGELQTESRQLDDALMRLSFYEILLDQHGEKNLISIRSGILELQSEFFASEPDMDRALATAARIFDDLRDVAGSEDGTLYTQLLLQMNQLTRDLSDYGEIKSIELKLEEMISALRDEPEAGDGWGGKLTQLRAQISAMPIYIDSEGGEKEEGLLSTVQKRVLREYDRDIVCGRLDDITRRYVTKHSAIYQGIIYLQSPYRALAVFALVLALSFDLAGFVFGVVIEGNPQDQEQVRNGTRLVNIGERRSATPVSQMEWSVLPTREKYYVLTGDYEHRDETYHYKVFYNGVLEDWIVEQEPPYSQGIYRCSYEEKTKGEAVGGEERPLCFSGQQGTVEQQDGIYKTCGLIFREGSLLKVTKEREEFIASVEEYVPVHSYDSSKGENRTFPVKDLKKAIQVQTAVVALNEKGTRVVAIYIIEKND